MTREKHEVTTERREFLVAGAGTVAAVALGGCGGTQINRGTFPAGSVDSMAVGSLTLVESGPFVVGRDDDGIYAMSAVCTHFGCTVSVEGSTLPCACHGSVFDATGQAVEGPARRPLEHYRVSVDAGTVSVDTTEVVPAETRVSPEG